MRSTSQVEDAHIEPGPSAHDMSATALAVGTSSNIHQQPSLFHFPFEGKGTSPPVEAGPVVEIHLSAVIEPGGSTEDVPLEIEVEVESTEGR
jgi:hypothetical protein